jgi:hypothetical protein
MFKETIPVYLESHNKHLTTRRGQNSVSLNSKKGDKYSNLHVLNDLNEYLNFYTMKCRRSRFCFGLVLARFAFNVHCILISIRLVDGFLASFVRDRLV